jgi:hypothetical protein
MVEWKQDIIATQATVKGRTVCLELSDGSTHSFPVRYYPRLAGATPTELAGVRLRVGGRALRWEALDEDIWIADAIGQNYPTQPVLEEKQ